MFGRRRPIAVLVGAAWSVAVSVPAEAQADLQSWASSFEFGFTGAAGNSSFSILTAGGSLERVERDDYELALAAQIRYGKGNDALIANDAEVSLTFDWDPDGEFSPFVLSTFLKDVVRGLDTRIFAGGGLKWTFWEPSRDNRASVSGATLVEHERFARDAAGGSTRQTVSRFSGRTKVNFALGPNASFQQVTFWQPRLTRLDDYILDVESEIETGIVATLTMAAVYTYVRESVPPPGARPEDHRFGVVLRMRF
jgi:hypothetical protein